MAVSPADGRAIVERVCARPDVLDACARRDLGTVISALTDKRTGGLTQGRISELTGIPQGRLSEWKNGTREPKPRSTDKLGGFERVKHERCPLTWDNGSV
jgi:hypothetical protein